MIFDNEITQSYDDWLKTPIGRYIDGREKSLILDLTAPRVGEKVLDMGCGTGEHLILFMKKGCQITGVERSPYMLDMAKQKLGNRADLYLEKAESLPFPDNEFDIVSIISALEFMDDPQQAISEAIRVCRGRVFLGGMNKLSLAGNIWKYKNAGYPSVYRNARFFHIGQLTGMVRTHLQGVRIQWGSVVFLPYQWYSFATGIEEKIPIMKNPFGAFWGLSFPVTFTYRTIQDIIREPFEMKPRRRQPATGIVREIRK
ncbi:MAG: class I SAM-dependent methyltransferase [Deltaproteobacteria bacterium]|nr:class I SAM-dependent methyltransferase [Deltaproteobacteria bacterium]